MRIMWCVGILFVAVLAGCGGPRDIQVGRDAWTGTRHITTREIEIHRDGPGLVFARPIVLHNDAGTGFAVLTMVQRRDANGPRVEKMTAFGRELPYTRHDRLLARCLDGCNDAETGAIILSEAAFRAAAVSGLPLRVWGTRGRYDGVVPPWAFGLVLATYDAGPQ